MGATLAVSTCSRETVRCPDARNYSVDLRDCCRRHIVALSKAAALAFEDAGVRYWADYGTLLGAVRNPMLGLSPGIIPHDKDADWGVYHADWAKAVRVMRDVERQGRFWLRVNQNRHSMKLRLSQKNHTNLDLFFWFERRDGTLYRNRYAVVDQFKGREFHRDRLFPLARIEWEGMSLPAPVDPASFLAFRYGPGWKTPIAANNDGVRR